MRNRFDVERFLAFPETVRHQIFEYLDLPLNERIYVRGFNKLLVRVTSDEKQRVPYAETMRALEKLKIPKGLLLVSRSFYAEVSPFICGRNKFSFASPGSCEAFFDKINDRHRTHGHLTNSKHIINISIDRYVPRTARRLAKLLTVNADSGSLSINLTNVKTAADFASALGSTIAQVQAKRDIDLQPEDWILRRVTTSDILNCRCHCLNEQPVSTTADAVNGSRKKQPKCECDSCETHYVYERNFREMVLTCAGQGHTMFHPHPDDLDLD